MVDVRGDVLRPPHGTTPAAVKSNKSLHKLARNFLNFGSNGLKRVRSVLKLDSKGLKAGSGLTLTDMSRVRNGLYYGVDFGKTFYLLRKLRQLGQQLQTQIWRLPDPPDMHFLCIFCDKKSEVYIQINTEA